MSAEERAKMDRMAKDIAKFKTWWPVIVALFGVITMTVTVTRWYGNTIAQKSDIQSIKKDIQDEQEKTREQIADLKKSFDAHVVTGDAAKANINKRIDSLRSVTYVIQRRLVTRFVTESYPHGRNGKPNLNPVN